MDKLTQEQIDARISKLAEWSQVGEDAIQRTFRFEDFLEAMTFVNRVAKLAEKEQHHPDIMVRYNKVTLTLSTHDAGGITEKDLNFAKASDKFVNSTPGG